MNLKSKENSVNDLKFEDRWMDSIQIHSHEIKGRQFFISNKNKLISKIKYDWIFSSVISQIISNFVVDMHQTVSLQTVFLLILPIIKWQT